MIASDVKGTVIKIAEAKFEEIFRHWPLLRGELATRVDDGKTGVKSSSNYYELVLKNGSRITVVSRIPHVVCAPPLQFSKRPQPLKKYHIPKYCCRK